VFCVTLAGSKQLIGCVYQPNHTDVEYALNLQKVLTIACNTSKNVVVMGDFNLPDINWQSFAPCGDVHRLWSNFF